MEDNFGIDFESMNQELDTISKETSIWVRLKDGDTEAGVWVGKPYVFYENKFGDNRLRVSMNFAVQGEDGEWRMKVVEQSRRFFSDLQDTAKEYGDTAWTRIYKIKRTGSGKSDTRYSVIPLGALSDLEVNQIKALDLLDLEALKVESDSRRSQADTPKTGFDYGANAR